MGGLNDEFVDPVERVDLYVTLIFLAVFTVCIIGTTLCLLNCLKRYCRCKRTRRTSVSKIEESLPTNNHSPSSISDRVYDAYRFKPAPWLQGNPSREQRTDGTTAAAAQHIYNCSVNLALPPFIAEQQEKERRQNWDEKLDSYYDMHKASNQNGNGKTGTRIFPRLKIQSQ